MLQDIIVYIVVAGALGGAGYYLCRKLRALKKNSSGGGCSECPLKDHCDASGHRKKKP